MRVYQLTNIGRTLSRTPAQDITDGWRVVYFMRRHQNTASDDQISQVTGIDRSSLGMVMKHLKEKKVVQEIG